LLKEKRRKNNQPPSNGGKRKGGGVRFPHSKAAPPEPKRRRLTPFKRVTTYPRKRGRRFLAGEGEKFVKGSEKVDLRQRTKRHPLALSRGTGKSILRREDPRPL